LRVLIADDDVHGGVAAARLKATIDRLDTFRRWGLTTLGDIAALPSMELSERMGQDGLALQQFARGIDRAPLVPDPGVPRFLQSMELEWPIDALEPLSFVFARLLDPLSSALEHADRGAAAVRLDLRLVDRTAHSRVLQLPAAMRDAKVLRTLLLLDLESHPPSAAVDVVTIEIDPVPGRIVQYSLLEHALPSPETLATLTARLGALVGDTRCGSPVLLDTWRPDGFEMTRFAPASSSQLPASSSQLRIGRSDPGPRTPDPGSEQRTARSEERGASNLILRRFRPPIAIRVTVDRGRPVRVAIDRRGMPGGQVERAAGPWRTSGAWWDPKTAAWDRDEWDAALSDGSICRICYDRIAAGWFLEAILD
jgi:protein ImuB